jgi:sterol desaturase/sphingolipid hydroxylase (fatty acid hydroxylase superfamily)
MMHLFIFSGLFVFFFFLESIFPERKLSSNRKPRVLFHSILALGNTLVSRLILITPLLWLSSKCENAEWTLMTILKFPPLIETAVTIVLVDVYEYGWHRLNHSSHILWRFHRAHHIDEELDVMTALRFHVGELALSYIAKAFFIVLIGPSWLIYLIARLMISCFALFHHSNIHLSAPIQKTLGLIFMTPRVHAGHHTVTKRTREANYSTIFIFWDKLFKSYKEPREEEIKNIGLPDKMKKPLGLLEFLLLPWS